MTKTPNTSIEHSAAEAVRVISDAADKATTAIASAALDATKLLAFQTADAAKVASVATGNDHDLIIEIKTVQQTMLGELREIKDGTAQRIKTLEDAKLDIKDSYQFIYKKNVDAVCQDHENRIRSNETNITRILTWGSALLILLGIAEFFVAKFLIH
jgi:hypothetical protein